MSTIRQRSDPAAAGNGAAAGSLRDESNASGSGLSLLTLIIGRTRIQDSVFEPLYMKKSIALMIAASALFLAGCCTTSRTARWEYKVLETPSAEDELNRLGDQGWSVVGATTSTRGVPVYVLKRAKR